MEFLYKSYTSVQSTDFCPEGVGIGASDCPTAFCKSLSVFCAEHPSKGPFVIFGSSIGGQENVTEGQDKCGYFRGW